MKKKFICITLIMCIVLAIMPNVFASSSGTMNDSITWTLDEEGVLTISGTGDMPDFQYGNNTQYRSDLNIIKKVNISEGITHIAAYAFSDCKNIISITLPNSLISIGDMAFCNCYSLKSISIPNTVSTIGMGVFSNCRSLTSFNIPTSVTVIGAQAFSGLTAYTGDIIVPEQVTEIGMYAFYGTSNVRYMFLQNKSITLNTYSLPYGTTTIFYPSEFLNETDVKTFAGNGNANYVVGYKVENEKAKITNIAYCSGERILNLPEKILEYQITSCDSDLYTSMINQFNTINHTHYWKNGKCDICGKECTHDTTTIKNASEPTCIKEGYTGDEICNDCGATIKNGQSIQRIEHNYVDGICDMCGKKQTFAITTTASEGGDITPTSPITVEYGANQELVITAKEGYKIKSVKVDNIDKTSSLVDGKLTLSNVKANAKVDVEFVAEEYEFTEGQNSTYTKDDETKTDMQFKLNGLYELFDKLYVNGTELSKDNYTVTKGSTIINLKNDYLSTLDAGTYTLKATYTNGSSDETTFVVEEKKNTDNEENKDNNQDNTVDINQTQDTTKDTTPKTGDNIIFFVGALAITILGTAVVVIKKNKMIKTSKH